METTMSATDRPAPLVELSLEGAVAVLTLARPPVNAIDDAFLDRLDAALEQVEAHPELAVLLVRSRQKVFSAGADLQQVASRLGTAEGAGAMVRTVRRFHAVFDRLAALPVVTVAEIEGAALGGGLELALACDLRVAAHQARLGLPEAKVGLLPGAGGTQRLTRLCGPGVARRIILTGELVDGREAERLGIIQWSCDAGELASTVDAIVSRIAALSPPALRAAKGCIQLALPIDPAGVAAEIDGIGFLMRQPDTEARVASFLRR
jgi:enoyl-CoA hydratase/carnithine racemase